MVTLNKPAVGDTDWTTEINDNWTNLENVINQVNYVANGGFEAWPGTTSYSSPADEAFVLPGWHVRKSASPTFTVERESASSNVSSGAYSFKVDVTAGVVSGPIRIVQKIASAPALELRGKSITFTARVKTSSGSKAKLRIDDGATQTDSSFHSGGGTFETLSVTATIGSSATLVTIELYVDATAAVTAYFDEALVVSGSNAGVWRPPSPLELGQSLYGARAYRSGTQSIPDASFTKLELNAETYDVDGDFDSSTNYRYTAPVPGFYLVIGKVEYPSPGSGTRLIAAIYKNGTKVSQNISIPGASSDAGIMVEDILYLNRGDYVELYTHQNSGASKNVTGASENTYLAIRRMSP